MKRVACRHGRLVQRASQRNSVVLMAQFKDPLLVASAFVGNESRSPSRLDGLLVADTGPSAMPSDDRTANRFWCRDPPNLASTAQPALR